MASQPTIHDTRGGQTIGDERPLTRDEAWDLIFSLHGSAKEMFAEVGGGEAWIRFLRNEATEKYDDFGRIVKISQANTIL